ncbi:MAG: cyclopropane-fatty-acyl-phospholipid synthase, partial [Alphaproteobacteria bacterium]
MAQKNTVFQEAAPSISTDQFIKTARNFTDKLLAKVLSRIEYGRLTVITPSKLCIHSEKKHEGPEAILYIKNTQFLKRVFSRGDIGLGESFIDGDWDTPDLYQFLSLCAVNADNMGRFADGAVFQKMIWRFINLFVRRNTKSGSRKNIMAHYDVGNDFYSSWLDKSLTYSAAIFKNDTITLEEAQAAKYQRILDELPQDTQTILEIGCGWGGFAEYASSQGKQVTGITISPAQYAHAQKRLGNAAEILLCDYRDLKRQYDAIVSIEMFEAVGEEFWAGYFETIKACLKPQGKAVIQSITVRDDLFDDYRKRNDFIRYYTFPGGMLPSTEKFIAIANKTSLDVNNVFHFGQDYKKTLLIWLDNLNATKADIIRNKGVGFLKSWQFYLALCAAGFECERINVAQF